MKHIVLTTLFILLAAALILSSCAPNPAQASNPGAQPPANPSASPRSSNQKDDPGPLPATANPLVVPATPAPAPGEQPDLAAVSWVVDDSQKTYTSDLYHYQVSYPGNWTAEVNTGKDQAEGQPENVTFATVTSFPRITVYALTGLPPFTGYESCQSNLVFRGLDACRISNPAGQNPASELLVFHNGDQNFEIILEYEDPADIKLFDDFLTTFQFTAAVVNDPSIPVMKSFASKAYGYSVKYPADWTISVDTRASTGSGSNPEYVTFTPPSGSTINIVIYALTGEAPFSGYENCDQNFTVRDLPACRISLPAGQIPATELFIFQKGEAHFEIAMQHEGESAQQAFDQFLTSFEFK